MDLPTATVQIFVNGDVQTIRMHQTVVDVITDLDLPPQTVLVEHNGQALLRAEWPECRLAEGDRLEILRVVAGG